MFPYIPRQSTNIPSSASLAKDGKNFASQAFMDAMRKNLYLGTSGLVLPVPNKQHFPPEFQDKPRLTYYASLFNSLEINSSFYKPPQAATYARWITEVPDDFRFTVKLWRGITHEPQLKFNPADVDSFMQAAENLQTKKGCLLIQLPPSLKAAQSSQLARLLERMAAVTTHAPWKVAVEFRNTTWYTEETQTLLKQFNATTVLHDMPASRYTEAPKHPDFIYLRFHGPAGDYKGGYETAHLREHAENVNDWLQHNKEVFIYFNNTIGDAIPDLQTLRALLLRQ